MKLVGDGLAACREAIEKEGGWVTTAMPSRRLPRRIPPARPLDRHMQGTPAGRRCLPAGSLLGRRCRGAPFGTYPDGSLPAFTPNPAGSIPILKQAVERAVGGGRENPGVETAEGRPAPFQSAAQIKYRSSGKRSLTLRWHPSRTSRPSRAIFPASRYKRTPVSSGVPVHQDMALLFG